MNRNHFTQERPLWISLSLAGLLALANNVWAASDTPAASPTPSVDTPEMQTRTSPADVAKPIPPSKSEMADSAFKKLDPTGKGYVAKEDTKSLQGFDRIFDKVDSKHTGKLDHAQFKKAWNQYASEKPSDSSGKAAY